MILDTFSNAERYEALHGGFKKAFDFIRKSELESLEPGRYEIDGDSVFALIQEYSTIPAEEKQFEAHRNYIDIQYMISGSEMMGYTPSSNLQTVKPYDSDNDAELYACTRATECELAPGAFAVFFPEDPHMPGCNLRDRGSEKIKKLVLKIRLK